MRRAGGPMPLRSYIPSGGVTAPRNSMYGFDRVYGYAHLYEDGGRTRIDIEKAVVLCRPPKEHLEGTGIAESMPSVMLGDRLLGVGVGSVTMEIPGGR
ncbi:MAG: hypothetical protein QW277_04295 [Methanothermobacter sp.]